MRKKPAAGHTPTPYELGAIQLGYPRGIYKKGHGFICSPPYGSRETIKAWPANAAFIVKAVNAHKDLHDALELAEGFMSGFEDDESQENMKWLLATIRAALKKGA